MPDNGEMNYQGLKDMVQEVNATQVAEDEVLTDQVYSYDAMDKVFERADKKADRLAAKDKSVERKPSIMEKLKENKENVMKKDIAEMPTKKKEIAVEM